MLIYICISKINYSKCMTYFHSFFFFFFKLRNNLIVLFSYSKSFRHINFENIFSNTPFPVGKCFLIQVKYFTLICSYVRFLLKNFMWSGVEREWERERKIQLSINRLWCKRSMFIFPTHSLQPWVLWSFILALYV